MSCYNTATVTCLQCSEHSCLQSNEHGIWCRAAHRHTTLCFFRCTAYETGDAHEWRISKSRANCRHHILQNLNMEEHIIASRARQMEASTSCFDRHATAVLQATQQLPDVLCSVQLARHATVGWQAVKQPTCEQHLPDKLCSGQLAGCAYKP